jgi:hypothetical protein
MERTIRLHFDLSFVHGPRSWRAPIAAALLLGGAGDLSSENVTLSTYYPAPTGAYTQMITTLNTFLARDGGGLAVGTSVPPAGAAKMVVMGGNVGIGTAVPASTLSVAGGVQLGDDAALCTFAKAGTLKWSSGKLKGCDGSAWADVGVAAAGLGVGQTWQGFGTWPGGPRQPSTFYTNTTDKPILVSVSSQYNPAASAIGGTCIVDGQFVSWTQIPMPGPWIMLNQQCIVPPGSTYGMWYSWAAPTNLMWEELR